MKRLLACLLGFCTVPAFAERVLIPIHGYANGANGSTWTSQLAVANQSDHSVFVGPLVDCGLPLCQMSLLPPQSSFESCDFGSWVDVPAEDAGAITLVLRVRDTSRQPMTWGTVIPTVRESEAFIGLTKLELLDVPVSPNFRILVRVYDFHPGEERSVTIRFYGVQATDCANPTSGDSLLLELPASFTPDPHFPNTAPPMIALPLWNLPELGQAERLRIEVLSNSTDLVLWAFASVTENETQHFTAITP